MKNGDILSRRWLATIIFLLFSIISVAQVLKPARWTFSQSKQNVRIGDKVDLIFKANIDNGWYLYSSDFDPDLGPMVTEFVFEPDPSYRLEGAIQPIEPQKAYDDIFEGDYTYFKGKGEFRQTITVLSESLKINGIFSYQVCSDIDGKCIPFEKEFSFADFDITVEGSKKDIDFSQEITPSAIPVALNAQIPTQGGILHPAEWIVSLSKDEVKVNEEIEVVFDATIDDKWYLYSSDFDPDLGPMVTEFSFNPDPSYDLVGKIEAINPSKGYDEIFEGEYTYFKKTGQFRQRIKVKRLPLVISGSYAYQVCSDVDGKCIPFDEDFTVGMGPAGSAEDVQMQVSGIESYDIDRPEDRSLLGFIIFAFISGLIALLTPCVFPMIPMTVTFFMKDNEGSRTQGFRKALIFGLSIVIIFTVLGMLVAILLGAETLNQWATHWIPNVFIFVIFMVFAMSFLGMFELTLPHSWVNRIDRKADKGGLGGVFFMAATLTLVSFSCTFPIVGSVLVLSTQGQFLKPVMGMFAFSMAFALPFSLFAAFPEWLKGLPKSGGWLNSVKVVLGFLELALGLKFLSVADQAYHWGLLDREVYLALWIVIFTMLGFYLLGKIRLPHDSKMESVGVSRLMLSVVTFSFVIYLIPGLWGAPLKALAGYLPPITTHDFNLIKLLDDSRSSGYALSDMEDKLCDTPKYSDLLEFPHGIDGYFDYDQAINCARQLNKPLFIDFTGHGCVNCREMEARVWSDPKVLQRLKNDFVVVALYVDDKKQLPESDWYVSSYDGKTKKTIGKQNADFQITRYNNNAQPFYVILDHEEQLLATPLAYNLDIQAFINFLDGAKEQYHSRQAVASK